MTDTDELTPYAISKHAEKMLQQHFKNARVFKSHVRKQLKMMEETDQQEALIEATTSLCQGFQSTDDLKALFDFLVIQNASINLTHFTSHVLEIQRTYTHTDEYGATRTWKTDNKINILSQLALIAKKGFLCEATKAFIEFAAVEPLKSHQNILPILYYDSLLMPLSTKTTWHSQLTKRALAYIDCQRKTCNEGKISLFQIGGFCETIRTFLEQSNKTILSYEAPL